MKNKQPPKSGIINLIRCTLGTVPHEAYKPSPKSSIQDKFYCELKNPKPKKCLNCETTHNHNNAFCSAKCCKDYKDFNHEFKITFKSLKVIK